MADFGTAGTWSAENNVTEIRTQSWRSRNGLRPGLETGRAPAVAET